MCDYTGYRETEPQRHGERREMIVDAALGTAKRASGLCQ
jgi:hypothetical protein